MKINHRPWMLEEAHRYCLAAEVLSENIALGRQAQINAALALEILMKSFVAQVVSHKGEYYEQYKSEHCHNLVKLAGRLPEAVKRRFGLSINEGEPKTSSRRTLERYADTFINDRYIYEACKEGTSPRPGYSPRLIELARTLIDETIKIYKETGCNDPWINSY